MVGCLFIHLTIDLFTHRCKHCRNLNIPKRAQNMHYRFYQKIALRKRWCCFLLLMFADVCVCVRMFFGCLCVNLGYAYGWYVVPTGDNLLMCERESWSTWPLDSVWAHKRHTNEYMRLKEEEKTNTSNSIMNTVVKPLFSLFHSLAPKNNVVQRTIHWMFNEKSTQRL